MRDEPVMLAHQLVAPSELWGSWALDVPALATLGLTAAVYGRGVARLGRRVPDRDRARRAAALYGGLVVVAVAVVSPLDALASTLFSAHMVQHLVLMLVAAPLLAYARPLAPLALGLPHVGRDLLHRTARPRLRPAGRVLGHPVVVGGVAALALWSWHLPSLYEAALDDDLVHVAEHAVFLGSALLFWAVVLRSGGRSGVPRPFAVLLVLVTGLQSTALGGILAFASSPLYPAHAAGARLWGLSPLEDQQLAGALMWGPPAILYAVVMGALLVLWFGELDKTSDDRVLGTDSEPIGVDSVPRTPAGHRL